MRNIKLTIEYDGTHFNGWQVQDKGKRTVQGEIEKACAKVFHKRIRLIGSGRTDSGVHALGQVANFRVDTKLAPFEILRAVNASLPEDITIVKVEEAQEKFHAQHSAKSKVYRYTILNRPARSALERNFCYHYPYQLNVSMMRQEARALTGRRDFKSFQASGSMRFDKDKKKNTVRYLKKLMIRRRGDLIYIDFEADGFLYKMVRNIMGTLLHIGRGRLPKGSIKRILAKKNRAFAGQTAKAKGLCLLKVNY